MGIFSAPLRLSSFVPKHALPPCQPFRQTFIWPSLHVARNNQRCGMSPREASSHGSYAWVRNFDRMSIRYAFWPRVRDRLTSV